MGGIVGAGIFAIHYAGCSAGLLFLEDSQTHVEQIQTRSYHPQISQIAAD
jgi:hypothetical protein